VRRQRHSQSRWIVSAASFALAVGFAGAASAGLPPDTDRDGIPDALDKCMLDSRNATADCDTDGDGYGNVCDPDFNQDYIVSAVDFRRFFVPAYKSGTPGSTGTDLNCNGTVSASDFAGFFVPKFKGVPALGGAQPGPSGLSCAGQQGCMSGPGLVNGVCKEECINTLMHLKTFQAVPSSAFTLEYWFRAFSGSDSNPCTELLPCRSVSKALSLFKPGTKIVFDNRDGSVWSPHTFVISGNNIGASMPVGSTITWGSSGSCPRPNSGTVIGIDPGRGYLVVRRKDSSETKGAAGNTVCAPDNTTTFTIASMLDTATYVSAAVTGTCASTDPCIWATGADPDNRALLDFDWNGSSVNGALFYWDDDVAASHGYMLVSALDIRSIKEDVVGNTSGSTVGGHSIAVNVNAESFNTGTIGGGGDANNNAFTIHGAHWLTAINSCAKSLTSDDSGAGSPVATVGGGGFNWIGQCEIDAVSQNFGTGVPAVTGKGGHLTFIGPYIHSEGVNYGLPMFINGYGDDTGSGASTTNFVFQFARTVMQGIQDPYSPALNLQPAAAMGDSTTATLKLYETTITGGRCIQVGDLSGAALSVIGRGLVLDDCQGLTFYNVADNPKPGIDLQGVYDPEDAGSLCNEAGSTADLLSTCQQSSKLGPNFFATDSIDSDAASLHTDGVQWSRLAYSQTTCTVSFNDANPDTITNFGNNCTDVTTLFTVGGQVRTTGAINTANNRVWRIAALAANTITLHPADVVTAESSTANVTLREYDMSQLAEHPEATAYQQPVAPYTFTIPDSRGYIPAFVLGEEIRAFEFDNGTVGGR